MSTIRSEVRKATSIRSTMGIVVAAVAVTTFGSFATVSSTSPADLAGQLHQQALFVVGAVNLSVFSIVIGARAVTDEFHHGTVVWTLLFASSRTKVLLAKAAVAGAIAALVSLASIGAAGTVAVALSGAKNGSIDPVGADVVHAFRLALAAAAWAAIGTALGALVRHATGTTVAAVVWILVVENILAVPLGPVADFLPGQAGLVAAGAVDGSIPAPLGGLALGAWTFMLVAVAMARLTRRPVITGG